VSDDPQAPPADPRLAAIDRIRTTAKWLIAAFAAVGALLAGTAPLSNVGKLDISSWRLWVAVGTAAVALAAVGAAIWAAARVLLPLTRTLPELARDRNVRSLLDENYELLDGQARTLADFEVRYAAARDTWLEKALLYHRMPTKAARNAEKQARARFQEFAKPVGRITVEGLLITVRERFRFSQRVMFLAAISGAVAIVVFTWAANPSSPSTTTTTTTVAVVVQTDPLGAGAVVSRATAAKLLRAHGLPASDVLSFSGPIAAETLRPPRTLLRYTSHPTGTGRFLTTTRFLRPGVAQSALHLPWTNTAACRQDVQVKHRTLVLVGAIAFGKPGVLQYEILEPQAFEFGIGKALSKRLCRE
jgi:hypothetical protein